MSFEKPKTPTQLTQAIHESQSREDELQSKVKKETGYKIELSEEQFEEAKEEMQKESSEKETKKPKSHEEKKKEVHEKIHDIEERLGQPLSDKSKRMIQENEMAGHEIEKKKSQGDEKEGHQQRQEADNLDDKQREKESSTDALKEKLKAGEFADSVRKLASVLRERETNRFNPLIDPRAIQYMMSATNELDSVIADKKSSMDDINSSIKKIGGTIKAIGEVPRQIRVNDHPDSLRKVGLALQSIDQSSLELRSRIGGLEDKNTAETLHLLRSLEGLAKDKWVEIARKRNALEGRR